MSTSDHAANSAANRSHVLWLATFLVACLAVAFALYQVGLFFDEAFPHLYWSRTPAALAAVAFGIAGIAVPVWLLVKRNSFRSWPRSAQWQALAVVVLVMLFGYLTPFLLLVDASRQSRAILPYTPTVYLHHNAKEEHPNRLQFAVVGGPGTGQGGTRSSGDRVGIHWHAWLEPEHLAREKGPEPVVHLHCETSRTASPQTFDVKIITGRTVQFDTRGFGNSRVTSDGRPVYLPVELSAGTHRLTISK